ncbi:hypothetical protein ACQPWR_05525 [Micromonospora vinacea]|uniref:hypothetical protein n=1 Tax=Micromonospora vinacea TaxID=709878 RepID=UPI003D94F364
MSERTDVSRKDLRSIFEGGAVYADRWSPEVRAALDVSDVLADTVMKALQDGKSVVLSGNAGDGKSHLAQRALDQFPSRRCLEITEHHALPDVVPGDALIFIRDASGLSDARVLNTVNRARKAGAPLLVTINEGPLASLSEHPEGEYFRQIRNVLHERALGGETSDPAGSLVINLAGRQLTRSEFVQGVLDKLLPVVGPCAVCGRAQTCPRVVGAKMLRKSKRARERLEDLLRLLSDAGQHLSAREIWVLVIDLFFGWVCPPGAQEADRLPGYFWMRVFEGESLTSERISGHFDPVTVPLAREDVLLWRGNFDALAMEGEYPGARPVTSARESEKDGLRAFASAKRCYFFFGKRLDAKRLLHKRSLAPRFGELLTQAIRDPRPVIREIVGYMNKYRLSQETENELWISRHNGFAAHRRPAGLGASARLSIDELEVLVPHKFEHQRYGSGFFPTRIFMHWRGSEQLLAVDFDTWQRLQEPRTLTVDRDQETLDFSLDLFMAQAKVSAIDDPEILIYDHRRAEETVLRVRADERRIEVLR